MNGSNNSPKPEAAFALPSEKPKFDWLEKTGLVVYRCHDVWDRVKDEGIRDTWQKGLNIGNNIIADEFPFYVTEIQPATVRELARHILKLVRTLKQNGIMISGNPEKKISKIGTGTGVNTNVDALKDLGADAGIMTDDYYLHVRMGVHATEMDFPAIFVNHCVAEEWGVKNIALHLQRIFPSIKVFHIPQFCPYEIIF